MAALDQLSRPLSSLRLSVTDRCNLRCSYCMPEKEYVWLPKRDLLSFEEIGELVGAFTACGVRRVRLTGGEPLLRQGLPALIGILAAEPALEDLALTTNGLLLREAAEPLARAGLQRITVSLDTLRPDRYRELAKRDGLEDTLDGIRAAKEAGLDPLKIDTVVLRGVNDDELADLIAFGREHGCEVRFIEYMDVGGATGWSWEAVLPRDAMLERIEARFGPAEPLPGRGSAPAERYRLADGTTFGIIASTTAPFCGACDRSRLTADGHWYHCLYAPTGTDLRQVLRGGASREELRGAIERGWKARADRGAEERLALAAERGSSWEAERLRRDPHLEMHTRGG